MTRGNSPYSFSVGIPMIAGGPKVPIKHVFACSDLNIREPGSSQDPGDVCWGSTPCIILNGICPWALQYPGYVWRISMHRAILIKIYPSVKFQEMNNEAMRIKPSSLFLILDPSRPKRCVLEYLRKIHGSCAMFLITSRLKRYLKMQWVMTHTHRYLFLIITYGN